MKENIWNVPNILTLSRLPLAMVLFLAISTEHWSIALGVFLLASLTDWLDGWWARRYQQLSAFGRTFDPLIDKVLVGGAFIYLLPVAAAGLSRWMVAVVICREILITGIRGHLESLGKKFGADWFGKLKMLLQCAYIIALLVVLTTREWQLPTEMIDVLDEIRRIVLWLMLAATIGSGVQYVWKAYLLWRQDD